MTDNSKTSYQIRTKLLGMAQNHALEKWRSEWNEAAELRNIKAGSLIDTQQLLTEIPTPEFPTIEEVIEQARKMKDFLDNK